MNKYFLFLLMYIHSFFSIKTCFEYSPYDIITYNNANLSLLCKRDNEDLKLFWFKFSCYLSSNTQIYDKQNYVSSNKVLYIPKFENDCSYFQCIILKKKAVIKEKMFRIVNLESQKSKNYLFDFHEPLKPQINVIFSTNLMKTFGNRLEWFLWNDKKVYNIINSKSISVYNNKIEFPAFYKENKYGFIPCLVNIASDEIIKCGNSSFIHNIHFGKQNKIIYVNANDFIIMHCNDNNGVKSKWYKNGKELIFDHRILYNHLYIIISKFVSSDSGYYQCISGMPSKLPYYLSIFLVCFNDDGLNFPISTVINKKINSTFILPCTNPNQNEIPKFMSWSFNVFNQLSYASVFRDPSVNFDLYVYNANSNDNGFYQCLVYVSGQLIIYSFNIYIKSEGSNYLNKNEIHILKRRSVGEIGEITNFKFKAFTNNINLSWSPPIALVKKYTIKWGKMYPGPQQQIIDGKENRFTIPSLRPETTYFIKVVADTELGLTKPILRPITTKEENKEIFLTIPLNLKLLEVGDNWSRISWESRNNDEINEIMSEKLYQVEYCPVRSQRGQKIYKNTTDTTLKIFDVKPATTYEFAVRTCLINSSKCSDWSMVQEFTTLGTKPGDPPQHLTLSTIQLNSGSSENSKSNHMFAVQVSWQPPKEPNGEIKNYLILVTAEKRLDISNWGERTVSGKTLNTVIDRLDLKRYYYFRIRCSNEYGKSPLSPIRIFKTPDENGKNVGPIYLSKDYYNPMEINEELKLSRSIERGTDDLSDIIKDEKKVSKNDRLGLAGYKWWIIIGIVIGAALVFIFLFFIAIKCRNENANFESNSKISKKQLNCKIKYGIDKNEKVKFVNKGPILTTPDLFRHTKDQNCHSNYLELEERNESPNSFSSNKAFPGLNHNQSFPTQNNYRNIPGHYTPPGLIHQQNIVMTTSQLTSNSNERHFYQVPFLHHVGHNSFNVFANSAPRVNAAASDFNSINVPSPISDFSDFTSSQATILYDTSTAKSSGGKSSLSGSGSYNNGLGTKSLLTNEPILEAYSSEKNNEIIFNESNNQANSVSKAFSSEELCQEMANLEGLMKDLNNITQKEFEC